MDALQFAGAVTLTDVGGDVSLHNRTDGVTGSNAAGVRVWLKNGWGVMLTVEPGTDTATVHTVRFLEPFGPGWTVEPQWGKRFAPVDSEEPMVWPGMWERLTVRQTAGILDGLSGLSRVQPLPEPVESGNNFACPYEGCGQLAVRDLSTLDYGDDRQVTDCERCGKPIHRFPALLGTARAWRIGV